jgi:hypothetical protein
MAATDAESQVAANARGRRITGGSRYIEQAALGDRRAAATSSCDGSDPGGGAVRAVVRITQRLGMDYYLLISTLYLFAIFLSFPISN